jgi:hypothetical protein
LDFSRDLLLNFHSFQSVIQAVEVFFKVINFLVDAGNHDVVGVTAEVLLEQAGQFWVSVRDVLLVFVQAFDAVAQREKGLIDVGAFFEEVVRWSAV